MSIQILHNAARTEWTVWIEGQGNTMADDKLSLKVRVRNRVNSSPPPGMRQAWTEYQVVEGRKVVGRFDTEGQAEQYMIERARELFEKASWHS